MAGMGAASFWVMNEIISFVVEPIYRWIAPKRKNEDGQAWLAEVKKATRCTCNFVYFCISVYWGHFTLKDSTWLPKIFGGKNPAASVEAVLTPLFI